MSHTAQPSSTPEARMLVRQLLADSSAAPLVTVPRVWLAALVSTAPPLPPDRRINATEAARLSGFGKRKLYYEADQIPGTRRVGRRVTFSVQGLERWLVDQTAQRSEER